MSENRTSSFDRLIGHRTTHQFLENHPQRARLELLGDWIREYDTRPTLPKNPEPGEEGVPIEIVTMLKMVFLSWLMGPDEDGDYMGAIRMVNLLIDNDFPKHLAMIHTLLQVKGNGLDGLLALLDRFTKDDEEE